MKNKNINIIGYCIGVGLGIIAAVGIVGAIVMLIIEGI